MVEMMDGTIDVQSEFGKGSLFTVKLKQGFVTDAVIGPEMVKNLKNFHSTIDSKYARNSKIVRIKMPYAHVLVVDDNHTNLDVTQGMMRPYGMRVDCVTSGQGAIDAIREEKIKYTAIFMDHMMPEMDGIEATRRIRNLDSEYAKTIPIIALTANAVVGNEEMFLNNGFQAFLPKPIEIARLDEILRHWVRDKEKDKLIAEMSHDEFKAYDRRAGLGRRISDRWNLFGNTVLGLNLHKGIERFDDWKTFKDVLHSFVIHTRPLLDTVRDVSAEKLANYAITVHGIKGSSRGICAEGVAALASILEEAAKAGDFDLVCHHNSDFLEELTALLSGIEKLLTDMEADDQKPVKDKPDGELLTQLLTACENYDMDGVDAAMAKITSYEYESDDGLVAWLQESVEKMNFAEIKERLLRG
jgi:CheY-like chemotaxis protein